MPAIHLVLIKKARMNELEWQEQVHNRVPGVAVPIDNPEQFTASDGTFKPDARQADENARSKIDGGIGNRLQGAIALYDAGDQLECVRHLILALDAVCNIIGWAEASDWCNEQNHALYQKRQKRAA